VPAVVVADPAEALARLACWYQTTLRARTVGITGSQGKTSTKDLVAQVLTGNVVAPVGSYNNELGLPLTVLRAEDDTDFLVLEMSARGTGHIAWLCGIAPPEAGVVLNVGVAHLGEFGSREAIAIAKGELVEALPDTGLAILNADDPLVLAMRDRTVARVTTFGRQGDYRAEDVALDALSRAAFRLVTPDGASDVRLRLVGEHHVGNALAAAAVAAWAGRSVEETAHALSEAVPRSRWRMEVRETADGVTVINDAYNANPDSMRAALKTLVAAGQGRRTWAVLGEMAELGDATTEAHDEIGRLCVRLDVSRLVVVGPLAKGIHHGAALEGSWGNEATYVDDTDAAIALLRTEVRPGDVVLVKASRAAGLERVALALTPDEETDA
jgi:UDP-N-acetylmuramoyl-tripeptide--D-alanyl-D-alanine ligase